MLQKGSNGTVRNVIGADKTLLWFLWEVSSYQLHTFPPSENIFEHIQSKFKGIWCDRRPLNAIELLGKSIALKQSFERYLFTRREKIKKIIIKNIAGNEKMQSVLWMIRLMTRSKTVRLFLTFTILHFVFVSRGHIYYNVYISIGNILL